MKINEIKEILDNFEKYEARYKLHNETQFIITHREIQILLDYITNLQQDNTMYAQLKDEYEEEIKDLQQENERLKKALNCKEYFSSTMPEDTEFVILTKSNYDRQQKDIQLELIDYKYRCEKAIKYINTHYLNANEPELLNILQNGSDEE